ncbi:MAG: hypothetical protein IT386_16265 [Deltaproteobacteria bacterium]|nr:hypothetical protein [Deltaproteobacteria bacterium]
MTATSPWIELSIPERRRTRRRPDGLGALFLGVLLAALALSALRVHVTQLRYERAAALTEEQHLADEERRLAAAVQSMKDPRRLAELAKAQGFVRPERLLDLPVRTAAR